MTWQDRAACKGMDPELFFPDRGQPAREAKAACAQCPVRDQCAEAGLTEYFGVWGGESERQRRRSRKMRQTSKQSSHPLVERVAAETGVRVEDILSSTTLAHVVEARYQAIELLRAEGLSYPAIGRIMNRHHTAVMVAYKKVAA